MKTTVFGTTRDGKTVHMFSLTNAAGHQVDIINFGGIIVNWKTPDKNGRFEDINLGFDTLAEYEAKGPYFGALIGRHGNRIENSEFVLNGVTYQLDKNDGKNNLHGGSQGFDKKVWEAETEEAEGIEVLKLSYFSPDMEENFPGNLNVTVRYSLSEDGMLLIDYHAVSDKDTVINMTNHAYFNLAGHRSGAVDAQLLQIDADFFTFNNKECVPTGEILNVSGTPMDFTAAKPIGKDVEADDENIRNGGGYDHNFILRGSRSGFCKCAEAYEPVSGRLMEVFTDKPGVQLYSGNFLDGLKGKEGAVYHKRGGFCLETQFYPNAMKLAHFPSPVLKAGETYHFKTGYRLSVR